MAAEWAPRTVDGPAADMLSVDEVARLFGVSATTITRLVAEGEFPAPLVVGKSTKVWEWKAVVYYRLKLELACRLEKVPPPNGSNGAQTTPTAAKPG